MTRLDGADLSHYQSDKGPIDWPTLRAATWWVAHKATQGVRYVDPAFDAAWPQMGQGFTHRLAYHWLSPNDNPAQQAAHFLDVWDRAGGAMLDAEEGGITVAAALTWLRTVEGQTKRPCSVYTGAFVAGGQMWQHPEIRVGGYGPRPMHLAAYTTEAKALVLPGVAANPWSAWQFSSNGPVPGVTGRCDMNRVDNRGHYDIACGVTAAPAPPQGDDDMPTVITNDQAAQFTPRNEWKWVLDRPNVGTIVASKRHLGGAEHAAYGSPVGVSLNDAQLNDLPDYIPDTDEVGTIDQVARDAAAHANAGVDAHERRLDAAAEALA